MLYNTLSPSTYTGIGRGQSQAMRLVYFIFGQLDERMKQIIAMGGGGFTMEPGISLLDEYILQQSSSSFPKVCFIPTASGDSVRQIEKFYQTFERLDCQPSFLALFDPPENIEAFLLAKDILYVGGGHTKNMLLLWKAWGVDSILKKAWNEEIILAGVSSGAVCWFEEGLTDSLPGRLSKESDCLGLLPGSFCAHYDAENRRPAYQRHVAEGELKNGIGVDNFAALHYIDDQLHQVVSASRGAAAYATEWNEGTIKETELTAIDLAEI